MTNTGIYFVAIALFVLIFNTALAVMRKSTSSKIIRFFGLAFLQVAVMFSGIILWMIIPEVSTYLNSPSATGLGWYLGIYFPIQIVGAAIANYVRTLKR